MPGADRCAAPQRRGRGGITMTSSNGRSSNAVAQDHDGATTRQLEAHLLQLRAGDEGAWRQLTARYHGALLACARSIVRDPSAAEEVVQDAMVRAFAAIGSLASAGSLEAWLFRCVKNRAIDELRSRRRWVYNAPEDVIEGANNFADAPGPWDRTLVERSLDARRALRLVEEELGRLPVLYQEPLRLKEVAAWDASDVCAALDIGQGTLRTRLFRGRRQLRAAVDERLRPRARPEPALSPSMITAGSGSRSLPAAAPQV